MNPPFLGTKVVTHIKLEEIFPLIDAHALFVGRWQFRRTKASEEAYREILKQKAWPAFEEWKKKCIEEKILEPKVVYGYFDRASCFMLHASCLNAQKQEAGSKKQDLISLQLVTVGSKVADKCRTLFEENKYTDYLYLHGLAVETTEALAEYWHRQILRELGQIPPAPPLQRGEYCAPHPLQRRKYCAPPSLKKGGWGGFSRISPGYPAWPNLSDQKELCRLLKADRIGVTVTETSQLVPEYSTSAMILMQETTSKPAI